MPYSEADPDLVNGFSDMSSNISGLNENFEVNIIDVEIDVNYIFIVFDHIFEDRFEILITPEGLTITLPVCYVHITLIQEVGYY